MLTTLLVLPNTKVKKIPSNVPIIGSTVAYVCQTHACMHSILSAFPFSFFNFF